MHDDDRDRMLVELYTDVKWIKEYIRVQNRWKLAMVIIFATAVIGIIV